MLNGYIVNNFDLIFPNYIFINKEVVIDKYRIDILGKDKFSDKDVIIELKIDNTNTINQLLTYSKYFDNPILISVNNGEIKNKNENIIYYEIIRHG